MARYGAKHIFWAPITEEPDAAFPTYGASVQLSELRKVSDNPTFLEGKQYGDDNLAEYVNVFSEADVDVEITDLPPEMEKAVLGASTATVADGSVTRFGANDTAPYGGLAFVSCIQRSNENKYQVICYPKLKAAMQGEEFTTKEGSITLAGGKLKFKALACKSSDWKIKSAYMDTEAAAKQFVSDFLSNKIQLPAAAATE